MFNTVNDIKQLAADTGNHFFDRDTMRFFNSRVLRRVYFGQFFVTSERDDTPGGAWDGQRRYTLRCARYDDGELTIGTVGYFGDYATAAEAREAALNAQLVADGWIH